MEILDTDSVEMMNNAEKPQLTIPRISNSCLIYDKGERLINYLNGRIRLIQSKYQLDEGDV
jgi:hypothetical protein